MKAPREPPQGAWPWLAVIIVITIAVPVAALADILLVVTERVLRLSSPTARTLALCLSLLCWLIGLPIALARVVGFPLTAATTAAAAASSAVDISQPLIVPFMATEWCFHLENTLCSALACAARALAVAAIAIVIASAQVLMIASTGMIALVQSPALSTVSALLIASHLIRSAIFPWFTEGLPRT